MGTIGGRAQSFLCGEDAAGGVAEARARARSRVSGQPVRVRAHAEAGPDLSWPGSGGRSKRCACAQAGWQEIAAKGQ